MYNISMFFDEFSPSSFRIFASAIAKSASKLGDPDCHASAQAWHQKRIEKLYLNLTENLLDENEIDPIDHFSALPPEEQEAYCKFFTLRNKLCITAPLDRYIFAFILQCHTKQLDEYGQKTKAYRFLDDHLALLEKQITIESAPTEKLSHIVVNEETSQRFVAPDFIHLLQQAKEPAYIQEVFDAIVYTLETDQHRFFDAKNEKNSDLIKRYGEVIRHSLSRLDPHKTKEYETKLKQYPEQEIALLLSEAQDPVVKTKFDYSYYQHNMICILDPKKNSYEPEKIMSELAVDLENITESHCIDLFIQNNRNHTAHQAFLETFFENALLVSEKLEDKAIQLKILYEIARYRQGCPTGLKASAFYLNNTRLIHDINATEHASILYYLNGGNTKETGYITLHERKDHNGLLEEKCSNGINPPTTRKVDKTYCLN